MRHAKKLGGAALFAAAVLLVQAAALAASPSETAASGEAPVYWVGDEARFKALFAGAGADEPATWELAAPDAGGQGSVICTLDLDGAGPAAPIRLSGPMEEISYSEDLTVREGTLCGEAEIGGAAYQVRAVVQREEGGSRFCAGVTVSPEDAAEVEDHLFFALGQPMVPVEQLADRSGLEVNTLDGYALQATASAEFAPSAYEIEGDALRVEFRYNGDINRAGVRVISNTAAVDEYFAPGGLSHTVVSSVEVEIEKADVGSPPYVMNVDDVSVSSIGFTGWDELPGTPSVGNASAAFAYRTFPLDREEVSFDEHPLEVTFNLESAYPAYGTFAARAEISYHTVYLPATAGLPVYLSIPGGEAQTQDCRLWVI